MTHVRVSRVDLWNQVTAVCGEVKPVSSISYEHWLERQINLAVAGQIERLPEGLCDACRRQLDELGV